MRPAAILAITLLSAGALSSSALAHHGFGSQYDCARPLSISGKVTAVEWINPHVWMHVRVAEAGKPVKDWMFEGPTPNTLLRVGLDRNNLQAGIGVTIQGYAAKDSSCPESSVTHVATCHAAGGALTLENGVISDLVEGSRPRDFRIFDDPNATPAQRVATLQGFCAAGPVSRAAAVAPVPPPANITLHPQLAAGVATQLSFVTETGRYLIANPTPFFSDIAGGMPLTSDQKIGTPVTILARVWNTDWLLVGRDGLGVGYVPRARLRPAP